MEFYSLMVYSRLLKLSNNTGSNYEFISDTTAGISTVQFSGITSTNGDFIVSEFDINQNQVPRGGLIVSLGSTPGQDMHHYKEQR